MWPLMLTWHRTMGTKAARCIVAYSQPWTRIILTQCASAFFLYNVWKYSPAERVNIQTHQLKTDADTDIIIHKNPWAVEKIILTVMFAHSFKLQIYSWDTVANWHLISMTKFRLSSGLLKRLSPSQNDVQRKHLP